MWKFGQKLSGNFRALSQLKKLEKETKRGVDYGEKMLSEFDHYYTSYIDAFIFAYSGKRV